MSWLKGDVDGQGAEAPSICVARKALVHQGFRIAQADPDLLIALRSRWHADCLTRATVLVRLKRVDVLDVATIEADERHILDVSHKLQVDGILTRLLGVRVFLLLYLADRIDAAAAARCQGDPDRHWSRIVVPAARDAAGSVHRLSVAPLWFVTLFPKYSFVIRKLLEPASAPTREPISAVGVAILLGSLLLLGFVLMTSVT